MTDLSAAVRRARAIPKRPAAVPAPVKIIRPPPPIMGALIARFGPWWGATITVERSIPRISKIQRAVARYYRVSVMDIFSARKTADIVRIRHVAMYLAKTMTMHSFAEIGRRFEGKDHTTVLHAVRRTERLIEQDEQIASEVTAIKAIITSQLPL